MKLKAGPPLLTVLVAAEVFDSTRLHVFVQRICKRHDLRRIVHGMKFATFFDRVAAFANDDPQPFDFVAGLRKRQVFNRPKAIPRVLPRTV